MSDIFSGKIITFCSDANAGVIEDQVGRHYVFNLADWMGFHGDLIDDISVQFEARDRRAVKVAKTA